MARRALLAGAALVLPGIALPVPDGDELAFDVMRNGSRIGTHVASFRRSGDDLTVTIKVALVVGLGPIAFFRYKHEAIEHWSGALPMRIDTRTNDDGTPHRVTGRREADGFHVEGDRTAPWVASPDVLPGSHWNKRMLDGPALINTQDGRRMRITVKERGQEAVGRYSATRYSITGDLTLDTFYAGERWVGLAFQRGGSNIRYQPAT